MYFDTSEYRSVFWCDTSIIQNSKMSVAKHTKDILHDTSFVRMISTIYSPGRSFFCVIIMTTTKYQQSNVVFWSDKFFLKCLTFFECQFSFQQSRYQNWAMYVLRFMRFICEKKNDAKENHNDVLWSNFRTLANNIGQVYCLSVSV